MANLQLFYQELSRKKFGSQQLKEKFTSLPFAHTTFSLTHTHTHTHTMIARECHWLKTGQAIYQTSLKQETIGKGIFTQQLVALNFYSFI